MVIRLPTRVKRGLRAFCVARKTRYQKVVHASRMAVRRSISGALIGGSKAGKRYITVWHDAAV